MSVVNESFKDILSLVSAKLKGVIDDKDLGRGEVVQITMDAKGKLRRYMGRVSQSWETVTWGSLFKYLTMPDQLGLTGEEVLEILRDAKTRTSVSSLLKSQSLLTPDYFSKYWLKTEQPISGSSTASTHAASRAEAVCTLILELAVVKHLDKKTGGEEMPATPKKSRAAPAAAPTATAPTGPAPSAAGSGGGPLVKPTPPVKTGNTEQDNILDAIYKLQLASYTLQGGAP